MLPPTGGALGGLESLEGRVVGLALLSALAVGFGAVVRAEGLLSVVVLDISPFPAFKVLG
jgi:hypothetical protein